MLTHRITTSPILHENSSNFCPHIFLPFHFPARNSSSWSLNVECLKGCEMENPLNSSLRTLESFCFGCSAMKPIEGHHCRMFGFTVWTSHSNVQALSNLAQYAQFATWLYLGELTNWSTLFSLLYHHFIIIQQGCRRCVVIWTLVATISDGSNAPQVLS